MKPLNNNDYQSRDSFAPRNLFVESDRVLSMRLQLTDNIFKRANSEPKIHHYLAPLPLIRGNKLPLKMTYEIHYGFTLEEDIIIDQAMQIIVDRLFQPEILQNMYKICRRSGYSLEEGVWQRSRLKNQKKILWST